MLKIGLDFDGVILDSLQLKLCVGKSCFGVEIPPHLLKTDALHRERPDLLEVYRKVQNIIYNDRASCSFMKPVAGALEVIPHLLSKGHQIVVVTARKDISLKIAEEWARQQRLQLQFVGVGYGNSKADAVAGCHAYVDDDFDQLESLIGVVPNLFLFSWEYNLADKPSRAIKRIYSWEELYREILNL